jgi:cytochrome b pre-mRNA-processing protein 3
MFKRFRSGETSPDTARRLHDAMVARARALVFHRHFGVPDTIDGRFDLLTVHAFLILEALASCGPEGKKLATELVDLLFAGFDDALRELGVSDFGIARRMKAMAGAFYGRLEAYREAQAEDALTSAVVRNVYRSEAPSGSEARGLAHYMLAAQCHLRASTAALLKGDADFGPVPQP